MKRVLVLGLLIASSQVWAEDTLPVAHAKKEGIKKCLPMLTQVSDFILGDNKHGADSISNTQSPNERLYNSQVIKGYSDGDSHVNMSVAPVSGGKCDAVYTETFAFGKQCSLVREETFKSWNFRGSLNGTTVLSNKDGTVDAYLSPQGEAGRICLVTKREVVFER